MKRRVINVNRPQGSSSDPKDLLLNVQDASSPLISALLPLVGDREMTATTEP